ncbi:MAG: DUF1453 family protein [Pseudomonadota bacterium]|nr:DUF1453 family protein [Pseudomonadota bacterium]
MAASLHPSLAVTLGVAVFIVWRMASRVRRMVGRQRLSNVRPWLSVVIFPLLALLLLFIALAKPATLLALLAGIGVGVGLGFVGLRLTRFEATAEGLFYTPNAYLGVALSVLLIARLGWRYAQLYGIGALADGSPADLGRSPLTLLLFGMLAGYYAAYSAGLLRWKHRVEPAAPAVPVD